jgi:hypothetical protein
MFFAPLYDVSDIARNTSSEEWDGKLGLYLHYNQSTYEEDAVGPIIGDEKAESEG